MERKQNMAENFPKLLKEKCRSSEKPKKDIYINKNTPKYTTAKK